jgi:hypothetical protein
MLLDYGGEQLALYCGKTVGDLIVITLSKFVRFFNIHPLFPDL